MALDAFDTRFYRRHWVGTGVAVFVLGALAAFLIGDLVGAENAAGAAHPQTDAEAASIKKYLNSLDAYWRNHNK